MNENQGELKKAGPKYSAWQVGVMNKLRENHSLPVKEIGERTLRRLLNRKVVTLLSNGEYALTEQGGAILNTIQGKQ